MTRIFFSKFSLIVYFLIATFVVLNISKDVATSSSNVMENLNFVLLGKDGKEDDVVDRADAIMLVNIKYKENKINLISIPRDSLVTIPCGKDGKIIHKINHAYSYGEVNWSSSGGGGVCLASTVERLFDIPPTFYVLSSFDAVKDVINQVGGIDVVPKFSFCVNSTCFHKGDKVHLDGETALMYVRHRKTLPYGDIDRTFQQRQVIIALYDKVKKLSKTEQFKIAIYTMTKVNTNASIMKIRELSKIDYEKFTISTMVLKGSDYYIDGGYYYKINKQHLNNIKTLIK
jgi:LCP family protein required for cell wall assembly